MAYSFRTFLQHLEEKGELERVTDPVSPLIEINRITKERIKENGPAVFFAQVEGADMPVVSGILATRARIFDLLATDARSFAAHFSEKCGRLPDYSPFIVADSPCREVVIRGEDIDLTKLPLTTHGYLDGGLYITAGICIARDSRSGVRNSSFHRLKMQSKNRLGLWMAPFDLRRIVFGYLERDEPCPIAVVIGSSPYVQIAACTSIPPDQDELALAGALQEEAIALVKCLTVPLEVPAEAEIVLEGWVMPHDELEEGPFGETSGYYSDPQIAPVITISAITRRHDCIYQDIATGRPPDENQTMLVTHQAIAEKIAKDKFPAVKELYLSAGGCASFDAVVQIDKKAPGEARQIGVFLLAALPRVKNIWMVDTDIDPGDPLQVEWAYSTRCRGEKDIIVIKDVKAVPLEPCALNGMVDKIVFDCTAPLLKEISPGERRPVPCPF